MTREIRIIDTPVAREAARQYGRYEEFGSTWNTYVLCDSSICFCGVMLHVEFEKGQDKGEFFFISRYEADTLYLGRYDFLKARLEAL